MKPKLIYFHGFCSSAASRTVKTLRSEFQDFEVIARDIPVDPDEALPFLQDLVARESPDLIIGTSMGGMYAQQMFGYRRIIVNPAFYMSNQSKVLTVGEFEFFNAREDGATHFTVTPEVISHFAQMEQHQFDGITPWDRENVWGLFADHDDLVNGEPVFLQHYSNIIRFPGEHRLSPEVIHDTVIPLIRQILAK